MELFENIEKEKDFTCNSHKELSNTILTPDRIEKFSTLY